MSNPTAAFDKSDASAKSVSPYKVRIWMAFVLNFLVLLGIMPLVIHLVRPGDETKNPRDLSLFPDLAFDNRPLPSNIATSSGGRIVGVTGCWNENRAPDSSKDSKFFDISTPFYIRVRDFDGWILRRAINGALDGAGILDVIGEDRDLLKEYWRLRYYDAIANDKTAPVKVRASAQKRLDAIKDPEKLIKWGEDNRDKIGRMMKTARESVFPVVNGVALQKVKAVSGHEMIHPPPADLKSGSNDTDNTYDFYFEGCATDSEVRGVLETIAKRFALWKPVRVSVGLNVGDRVEEPISLVNHPFIKVAPSQQPSLIIAPLWKLLWLLAMIVTFLSGFVLLALATDILKAKDARLRPNGAKQWSLSHFQLAFWFMVVFFGFFYLWVLTGKMALPITAVTLCSIALVTAIGGEGITQFSSNSEELSAYNRLMLDRRAMSDRYIIDLIRNQMKSARARIDASAANPSAAEKAHCDYLEYARQLRFMQLPKMGRWLTDLLSENGDITLHRFQMLAWTLGLGAMFLFHVVGELSLPDLPGSLVALMGLSAGTYLGFRIPEARQIQKTLLAKESIEQEDEHKKTMSDITEDVRS
jgi:hypothetical protein